MLFFSLFMLGWFINEFGLIYVDCLLSENFLTGYRIGW
jgi:hypothetical protein